MAGGKETPRQRMIGILYLVLLGLIALSIPDSLMDAFKNITNSLDKSRSNVTTSINDTYTAFEKTKLIQQKERAQPIYNQAKEASKIANELDAYVEQLKAKLIAEGGGINPDINDVSARDNLDISPRVMITQKNADVLREKINETREKLLNLLGKDKNGVNFSLNAVDPSSNKTGAKKNWQEAYFGDGIPLGATLTTLAKIQADNKNAESEVVKRLLGKVDQAVVNLDKFSAVAVAPSSYVIAGQPYTAEVFLTASDSKSNPDISVGGSRLPTSEGKGKYSVTTSGEGIHTWIGSITVKQTDGTMKTYITAPQTYQVSKPSAVVSPDKMNVLYIGVPNPVSVSAPGIAKEKLKVSISGGQLSGSAGHYIATVSSIGKATITVSGDIGGGRTQVLGSSEFRVKRIPPPKAQFAGKSGGSTSSANIKAQDRIFAKLENFDFDARFNITHFTLVLVKPRQDAITVSGSGNVLPAGMRAALNNVSPGSTVVFRDIVAVGPDGVQQEIDPIVLIAN